MKREAKWDVVVIGGGPAGMMAAGRAAERGRRVLLLEKNPAPGKKLLITGGGRCNITNNKPEVRAMLAEYKESGKFLFSAFTQFGVKETINFFNGLRMEVKEEAEGRMFPVSEKSRSVLDALLKYMKLGGVIVRGKAEVTDIVCDKRAGEIIITLAGASKIRAHSCILATGGTSHPETGSTGEGFGWLKKLGHTVIKNDAALVPIALRNPWVKKLAGVALTDIKLTTFKNGVKQKIYKGKVLFTHVGISGPTVLNMSREVGELLYGRERSEYAGESKTARGGDVVINLDLFPNEDGGAFFKKLQALLIKESNKKIKNALSSLIPSALISPVLALARIDGETPNHSVRSAERKVLAALLKAVPLSVAGLLGQEKAVVSSGGAALGQINFKTMQSRLVPGLYMAGDVLNINRPSGGYSLQLCWTTGYVAGNSC